MPLVQNTNAVDFLGACSVIESQQQAFESPPVNEKAEITMVR